MSQAYAYILHLLSGFALLAVFLLIYTKATQFDEFALIRQGNGAAALSLSGAVVGFSLTLASSILHNSTFMMFVVWATGALVLQVITYVIAARILPHMNEAIHDNNLAMGGLMGMVALVVGVINAACLS
jgi:putative membrane protein